VRFDGRSGILSAHFLQGGKTVFPGAVNNENIFQRADFLFEVFDFFINALVADKQLFDGRVGDDVFPDFLEPLQIHGNEYPSQPMDGLFADEPLDAIVDNDAGFVAFGQTEFGKSAAEVVDPLGNLPARKPFILSGFRILGAQESDVRKLGYALLE